jgi:hypothetical protein
MGAPPRPAVEVRSDACEAGDVVACDSAPEFDLELDADTPYYVIVNGLLDSGGVALTIDATPQNTGCTPGEASCTDGVSTICKPDGTPLVTTCPGDCGGNFCGGDSCEMPVTVAPQLNGEPVVIESNRRAFSNQWDAMGGDGCESMMGDPAPNTPGPEFFLLIEGVEAGQTVVLDADQSTSSYGFYILENCTATTCVDAFVFDDNGANRGEFVAPDSGDVLVAVEAQGTDRDRDFIMEVSLTE